MTPTEKLRVRTDGLVYLTLLTEGELSCFGIRTFMPRCSWYGVHLTLPEISQSLRRLKKNGMVERQGRLWRVISEEQ